VSRKHVRYLLLDLLSWFAITAGVAVAAFAGFNIWNATRVDGSAYLPKVQFGISDLVSAVTHQVTAPKEGAYLGTILIPSLGRPINIYEGTTTATLEKGVGHFRQSVMPGVSDNTVLAGHRDTVFSKLGKVKKGELITITTAAGKFDYLVTGTRIVKANDKSVIVPTPTGTLTLSTCYPFFFFGSAPARFIGTAKLLASS